MSFFNLREPKPTTRTEFWSGHRLDQRWESRYGESQRARLLSHNLFPSPSFSPPPQKKSHSCIISRKKLIFADNCCQGTTGAGKLLCSAGDRPCARTTCTALDCVYVFPQWCTLKGPLLCNGVRRGVKDPCCLNPHKHVFFRPWDPDRPFLYYWS